MLLLTNSTYGIISEKYVQHKNNSLVYSYFLKKKKKHTITVTRALAHGATAPDESHKSHQFDLAVVIL